MIKAALAGALSDRARNERIHVLDAFGENPNTKSAIAAARQFSDRKNLLVVLARSEDVAWRSLRNADNLHLLVPDQLNAYDILKSDDVIFTDAAIKDFLSGSAKGKGAKAVASSTEIETEMERA
jgi:large subunit ribosomal protein L4